MQQSLIDTDILSIFLRGNPRVKESFKKYIQQYEKINFSIITYYEILSGLKHKDAKKQLDVFLTFSSLCNILPMTRGSCEKSASIYAGLRKIGTPVDDIDLLIAGIALENNLSVITNNTRHFKRIDGLTVYNWSK